MRGRSGFVPGLVVVEVAGFVFGAVVVPAGAAGAVVVPLVPPFVLVVAGVEVGGAGGNDVSGCGSGGNGFASMPAISSFIPSVLSPFLNLYQPVRASCQTVFWVANLGSLPASATVDARQLVVYAQPSKDPSSGLQIRLAWEIEVTNGPIKWVYLDAISDEIIATS